MHPHNLDAWIKPMHAKTQIAKTDHASSH